MCVCAFVMFVCIVIYIYICAKKSNNTDKDGDSLPRGALQSPLEVAEAGEAQTNPVLLRRRGFAGLRV